MTNRITSVNDPRTIRLRSMTRKDLADVVAIEEDSFCYPWGPKDFIECLKQRTSIGCVAHDGTGIVGYVLYQLCQDGLIVLNMAVHPWFRHQTVGTQMIQALKRKLPVWHKEWITVTVNERSLPAQLFFRANEFRCVATLSDQYTVCSDDAYVFEWGLNATPPL